MRFLIRIVAAAVSGAVIAIVMSIFGLYAIFAAGGYAREALVELPFWGLGLIVGGGALAGMCVALVARRPLPRWVQTLAVGTVTGIAVVVIGTLFVAHTFGGPSSIEQAPILLAGLVFGVPVG